MSAVGHGILTWTIPYVFRTPPGWNMLCRGPANVVKDGVAPLEGLVESDWSLASFSMNWKFTRPGRVEWAEGEPVAMLVPQQRGDLERFVPRKSDLLADPTLYYGYSTWIESRREWLAAQRGGDPEAVKRKYQKHYFAGKSIAGACFEGHQKGRSLRPFAEPPAEEEAPPLDAAG